MAKEKTLFTCNACGGTSPRWLGKCPSCGAWNSLVETVAEFDAAYDEALGVPGISLVEVRVPLEGLPERYAPYWS